MIKKRERQSLEKKGNYKDKKISLRRRGRVRGWKQIKPKKNMMNAVNERKKGSRRRLQTRKKC